MEQCRIFTTCESRRDVYVHAKDYQNKAVRLVRSLRKNGGTCKKFPVTAWYGVAAKPSDDTIKRLQDLGCSVVEGTVSHTKYPLFSKIDTIQAPFEEPFGMWMDTDMYVLGDFGELVFENQVDVAAPDNCYTFHKWVREEDTPVWNRYYDMLGIKRPVPTMPTCLDKGSGNFYFNSGLILFRNGIGFPQLYARTAEAVLGSSVDERELNFTQTSLSLTVLRAGYTWKVVPEKFHSCYALRHKLMPDTLLSHYQDSRVAEISEEDWNV